MSGRQARGGTLILGGGFAGAWVARLLGKRGRESTIVNRENFMLFASLLPEAASGSLEPRHVVVPLRMMCPRSDLIVGRAQALDADRRTVRVETEEELLTIGFDRLVIAYGAVARALPIPGLKEHALGFKTLEDAIRLRNHVLGRLEAASAATAPGHRARELSFVFVGAGYAGVEALAELHELVQDAMRYYPELAGETQRWILVDAAPKILPEIPTGLGDYAAKQLRRRGIDIRVGTTLTELEPLAASLSDGERVPTSTLVWTAGVRASPAASELGLPLDDRGRIVVDELLRVQGHENVYALGDNARVPNLATPDHPDPPTSQHALRQARRLAKNLAGDPKPYRYRMLGQVATLGRYRGIADVFGLKLRGFPGWFVTRTYHLYQLPLLSRKLRVVMDWTVSLLFRRDIAELGQLGHPRQIGD
jgi:NADH:ubiquinone reductase (H+-translocating)